MPSPLRPHLLPVRTGALVWPPRDSPSRLRLGFIAGMAIVFGVIISLAAGSPGSWPISDWVIWLGLSVAFGLAGSEGYESVDSSPEHP
jgi:hypothetical protein